MANFRLDPRFAPAFLRSSEIGLLLTRKLESVKARAIELAPDDPSTGDPDLKSSFEIEIEQRPRGFVGRLRNKNFKAHWHEFGTVKMPAHPFLRPALEAEDGVTLAEEAGLA